MGRSQTKRHGPKARAADKVRTDYFFFIGFFLVFAGAVPAGFSRPPIKVSASAALNGNWRTDD